MMMYKNAGPDPDKPRHRVHMLFVHDNSLADRLKDLLRHSHLLRRNKTSATKRRNPRCQHRWSIRHRTNTANSQPAPSSILRVFTEAANESTIFFGVSAVLISSISAGTCVGLTPSRITSACLAAARLSVVTSTPNCADKALRPLRMLHRGEDLLRRKQVVL